MNDVIRKMKKAGKRPTQDFLIVGKRIFVTKATMDWGKRFLSEKELSLCLKRWF